MMVKKLAVPLVNEKLLSQAVHCYIIASGISLQGFDFIRSRIPGACKMDIVTGMEETVEPAVLKRILKHYTGRINLHVFLNNPLQANMIMLDLPFRKTVAFVGSGSLSLGGIKDNEEVFWRVTDLKEIESLKSWFVSYFEFGEPLTEEIISEYEVVYHRIRQREIISKKERAEALKFSSRSFNLDAIKFKSQFFKKEDYILLSNRNADTINPVVMTAREALKDKFTQLSGVLSRDFALMKLSPIPGAELAQIETTAQATKRVDQLGFAFGRNESVLKKYPGGAVLGDFLQFQAALRATGFRISISACYGAGKYDRENLLIKLNDPQFMTNILTSLLALGADYRVEVAGVNVAANSFQSADVMADFFGCDNWLFYDFSIYKNFRPGDQVLAETKINETIIEEVKKLLPLYDILRHEF